MWSALTNAALRLPARYTASCSTCRRQGDRLWIVPWAMLALNKGRTSFGMQVSDLYDARLDAANCINVQSIPINFSAVFCYQASCVRPGVLDMASQASVCSSSEWPNRGSLATLLEVDKEVRDRMRLQGFFTRWPNPRTVGVPSVKAMSMNPAILEIVAGWWCPYHPSPKCLPIDLCRREVPGQKWD